MQYGALEAAPEPPRKRQEGGQAKQSAQQVTKKENQKHGMPLFTRRSTKCNGLLTFFDFGPNDPPPPPPRARVHAPPVRDGSLTPPGEHGQSDAFPMPPGTNQRAQ